MTGAAMLSGPIESHRKRLKLVTVTSSESIAKEPRTILLQIAPGGLRAPLLSYLWIRSQELKQDGKLYDAKQLRDLICDLTPHFPGVWAFHAWDMAWNISAATHTPEERWMWVTNGIRLLRDRGLYYNPDDLGLHRELGWIYFSKMGQYTDEMHMVYKRRWAGLIHNVLGAPPFSDTAGAAVKSFSLIAEAPRDLDSLVADKSTADFVERLNRLGIDPDSGFLEYYNRFSEDLSVSPPGWIAQKPAGKREEQIADLMRSDEFAAARAAVLAFARRKTLVEKFRLDPDWMLEVMKRYGPMDWRNVNSHAIYWSTRGLHRAEGLDLGKINALNTGRTFLGALKSLTRTGLFYLTHNPKNPDEPFLDWQADWRFVESTHREYLAAERILVTDKSGKVGKIDSENNKLRGGHITYLSNAVQQMYVGGRKDLARYYYDEIKNVLKAKGDVYELSLYDFVREKRRQTGPPTVEMTRALMSGAFRSAYRALAGGNNTEYLRHRAFAMRVYRTYMRDTAGAKQRLAPEAFNQMEQDFLETMLTNPRAIGLNVPLAVKAQLYNTLSPQKQQAIYPVIAGPLKQQCINEDQDENFFNKAFPAPPE